MAKQNQLARRGNGQMTYPTRNEFLSSFDRMFDSFFNTEFPALTETFGVNMFERHSYPKVDVYYTDTAVTIESEIPGLSKENLKIKMKDNVLTICGEKRTKDEENKKYLYRELKHSSFCRSFQVKEDKVDTKKITSKFEDGILTIVLPYKEKIEKKDNDFEIEIQ